MLKRCPPAWLQHQCRTGGFKRPRYNGCPIKLNAVVGLKGSFDTDGKLISLGVTCAVCHSTVDDSFSPGIGKRLDGWANRDLNVGAIISLTDNAKPVADLLNVDEATLRTVLAAWGPGKYDAVLFLDGKALRPDGTIKPDLIPSAYGMQGIELTTYTGWGGLSYWNNMVAVNEMHGTGNFSDPRINDAAKYPIATENGLYNVTVSNDLVTSKLPALREYQLSLDPPVPPVSSYDQASADLGKTYLPVKRTAQRAIRLLFLRTMFCILLKKWVSMTLKQAGLRQENIGLLH